MSSSPPPWLSGKVYVVSARGPRFQRRPGLVSDLNTRAERERRGRGVGGGGRKRQRQRQRERERERERERVCLFVGCLTSQQHASVSQGRICTDNFTCCHTEREAADQTFHLTQSQYTDTGPTSPSADPTTPGAWQGSRWSANF